MDLYLTIRSERDSSVSVIDIRHVHLDVRARMLSVNVQYTVLMLNVVAY